MTKKVEGQPPSEEEQKPEESAPVSEQEQSPVDPAPVSDKEEEQLSQQGLQDEVLAKVADLESQLRGLHSKVDKAESSLDKRLQALGVELSPDQKRQNDILNLKDEIAELKGAPPPVQPVSNGEEPANADPALAPSVQQAITDAVAEALKPTPTGSSAVTPSSGTIPPSEVSAEEAGQELVELRKKPRTQRTDAEKERAAELLKIMEEAD